MITVALSERGECGQKEIRFAHITTNETFTNPEKLNMVRMRSGAKDRDIS